MRADDRIPSWRHCSAPISSTASTSPTAKPWLRSPLAGGSIAWRSRSGSITHKHARWSRPRMCAHASWASKACRVSSSTGGWRSRARIRLKCCSRQCVRRTTLPWRKTRRCARKAVNAFKLEFHPGAGGGGLAARLRRDVAGDVLFDRASRGRYATDASIYQIDPIGVVVPKTEEDALRAMQIAVEAGVPMLARGAGSSQCGQTVGHSLVIDHSKYLKQIVEFNAADATVTVQPGVVLDQLNAFLRPHGLWFPVDVSTSAQATIGGMAGNNSCGSRSIRYGNMVHNVLAVDAVLPSGAQYRFGPSEDVPTGPVGYRELIDKIHTIVRREAAEIAARWPKMLRRVQGYNIDMVQPHVPHNLAHLLVGAEGTLAYSRRIQLKLAPIPRHKVLGVCHFDTFYRAMECIQQIVRLDPDAVELVDRTMIDL